MTDSASTVGVNEVLETVHTDDNGDEEIIYTPKSGSIIKDSPDDDATIQ